MPEGHSRRPSRRILDTKPLPPEPLAVNKYSSPQRLARAPGVPTRPSVPSLGPSEFDQQDLVSLRLPVEDSLEDSPSAISLNSSHTSVQSSTGGINRAHKVAPLVLPPPTFHRPHAQDSPTEKKHEARVLKQLRDTESEIGSPRPQRPAVMRTITPTPPIRSVSRKEISKLAEADDSVEQPTETTTKKGGHVPDLSQSGMSASTYSATHETPYAMFAGTYTQRAPVSAQYVAAQRTCMRQLDDLVVCCALWPCCSDIPKSRTADAIADRHILASGRFPPPEKRP